MCKFDPENVQNSPFCIRQARKFMVIVPFCYEANQVNIPYLVVTSEKTIWVTTLNISILTVLTSFQKKWTLQHILSLAVTFLKDQIQDCNLTQNVESGDIFFLESTTFQVQKFLNVMASKSRGGYRFACDVQISWYSS